MTSLHGLGWADDEIPPDTWAVPQNRASAPRNAPPPAGPYTGTSGELPAFTASGIDPKVLLRSPAPVRPALAAATTPAAAYAIAQRYAGMTDERAAQVLATDMGVPTDLAHAWASHNPVDLNAVRTPEPDTFFASAEQTRLGVEHQHRERMRAANKTRGHHTYNPGSAA
ncbi:hypothetical protein ACFY3B_19340 [Micromonospora parva]|uniref:Uncharacterized protein n=1 Tax=Micromonospora parva TaxID=1464048 RepID=A0ABW6VWW3_9ACTN